MGSLWYTIFNLLIKHYLVFTTRCRQQTPYCSFKTKKPKQNFKKTKSIWFFGFSVLKPNKKKSEIWSFGVSVLKPNQKNQKTKSEICFFGFSVLKPNQKNQKNKSEICFFGFSVL